MLYIADLEGRLVRVNRAFEKLTGYSRAEASTLRIGELIAPEYRAFAHERVLAIAGGAPPHPFEIALQTKSGSYVFVEVTARLVFHNGSPHGIQGFARDITGRMVGLTARAEAEAQLARFTHCLASIHRLATTQYPSLDRMFDDYLAHGCEMLGFENGAIVLSEGLVSATRGPAGSDLPQREVTELFSSGRMISSENCLAAPISTGNGGNAAIVFWSPQPTNTSVHGQSREIIELMARAVGIAIHQRNLADQLAHQARHDALTGLPNRVLLAERLTTALQSAEAAGSRLAVMFIDLDRFKQINDTLGHSAGDIVLQEVAGRVAGCMEEGDTLARMGGDEFTAILTNFTADDEVLAKARRLLTTVRMPCRVRDYELFVTASIGISFFPADGRDAATLLRNADAAMYSAKYRGKNEAHCYRAEVTAVAMQRLNLENHLRRALERDELRMVYQPQVDPSRRIAGIEVLLAWEHPTLGRIKPSEFIPIAEETGMILPIGSWVLRNAARTMSQWHRQYGVSVPMAVNVSALQFAQANFVDTVAEVLHDTGLPANCLELELTESLVMRDADLSMAIMRDLRALGVKIAIDDFGTGYSSLSYLRNLPADTLKIDQSFLEQVETDIGALALVQAIVVLGHTFGLAVTAEGVETAKQFSLVRRAGVNRMQGHLFGEARTPDLMEKVIARGSLLTARRSAKPHS